MPFVLSPSKDEIQGCPSTSLFDKLSRLDKPPVERIRNVRKSSTSKDWEARNTETVLDIPEVERIQFRHGRNGKASSTLGLDKIMTCREVIDFLGDYYAGELVESQRLEFDRHLAICDACVAYLQNYRLAIELGKKAYLPQESNLQEVPEDLVKAILSSRLV
jgi:putative zinc finger protein